MYIQKKGNAYYYRESVWDADKKKPITTCIYLGSNIVNATNKLKTIVEDKDEFNLLVAKIHAFSMPTRAELLDNTLMTIQAAIRQAIALGDDKMQDILLDAETNLQIHKSNTKGK